MNRKVFSLSDLHLFFNNMLEMRKKWLPSVINKGMTQEQFNEMIINKWNEVVGKNDIVIFLGDLTFRRSVYKDIYSYNQEIKDYIKALQVLKNTNGKKIWILGNHDRDFMTMTKNRKFNCDQTYLDIYRKELNEVFANIEVDPLQINEFIFTHEPMVGIQEGNINIHGHIHTGATNDLLSLSNRHMNVNIEFTNFAPKLIFTIDDKNDIIRV